MAFTVLRNELFNKFLHTHPSYTLSSLFFLFIVEVLHQVFLDKECAILEMVLILTVMYP